jgi:DNA-binding beta-propeller fold protein YncE
MVVDTRTDKVTRSIAVGHQPLALAIGRSSRLWVSDPNEGGLFEIDPDTGEEVGSIETGPNVLGIATDLDRDRLFATDNAANRLYVFPLG